MIEVNDFRVENLKNLLENYTLECFQCGECTVSCPIGQYTGDLINVRKIMRSAQTGISYYDNIWACALCKLCENTCPRGVRIVDTIVALRSVAFSERIVPEKMEKVVWEIFENGNPWGGKKKERSKWAEGENIKNAKDGVDVLLYVGCEAAYDPKQHPNIRAITNILKKAGINFGFLGNEERCCGEPVRNAGEKEYLLEIVSKNIEDFEKTGAKLIVTVSPHCSNMFKNVYKKEGLKMEVMHYTEYFYKLWKENLIKFKNTNEEIITYHDPCLLSRGDNITDEPRELLKISGGIISEMENSGKNSLCCGGGGNRMFMEFQGKRLSDVRTEQAVKTGSKVMITACPYCNMNLQDSVKIKSLNMKVIELGEFLLERIE
ncbi:MAG: (Fe-S)-binding protein [Thermoplasmata archaeon]